jgi:prophage regulatory protein
MFRHLPERLTFNQRKRNMAQQIRTAILRRKEVEARTGLSRSTIYNRIKLGTFPAPVPLGEKSVGWIESEIDSFLANCIAQRDNGKAA